MSTDPVAEYAEGLANLELGRTLLAVQDFFNVSESRDASPDLKARARLARGRTALLAGAELTAVSEWTIILDLPAVSPEILDEARHELLQVAGLTGTPHVALAPGEIFQHGQTNLAAANLPAAVAAFALVLEDPQSSRALRARVLADRGTAYLAAGAEDSAAADWNTVLASPSADAETRRKARTGLRRICLAAALRTTAIELNAGHLSFAIANYDSIFADGRLEEYEPYVAATMLLRLPEVPDELREQAARFVDRLRGQFGEPPTDIVAIPAIIVPSRFVTTVSKVAAGAEATCRFVGNRLPKTVREFSAHLVLGALAGAVLTGGVFLLFGILSVVLALDWLALIALPLIGAVLGAPFGAIIGVAVYLNPPNDQNSRRLSRRLRRGLIAASGAGSYATFLLVAAWATSPPATVSIEGPMIFIGVFAAICGVWGVFTDS